MKHCITKNNLLVCIFLSTFGNVFAQNWYLSLGSGYATAMSKQGISGISEGLSIYDFETNTSTNFSVSRAISTTFGAGFNLNATVGYVFSKNISLELKTAAYFSDKIKSHFNDVFGSKSDYEFQSKMLAFEPTFMILAGFQKTNPYLKFGPILGFGKIKLDNDMIVPFSDGSFRHYETSFAMTDGLAFGIHGAVGVLHQINKKWQLFVEINTNNLSYSPARGSYSKYSIDQVDYVGVFDTAFIHYDYVSELHSLDNQDQTKPLKVLKVDYPFGSLGLNFGMKYNFLK